MSDGFTKQCKAVLLVLLTQSIGNPVWFVLPLHSNEVDGDSSEHDHQAHTTHHWLRVQTEAQ